jgi:hypothetical protein
MAAHLLSDQVSSPCSWCNDAYEWTRNGGGFSACSETVTIAFDAEHKVSIQLGISAGVLETN